MLLSFPVTISSPDELEPNTKHETSMNRQSERIARGLTSTSSIRPEPFGSELKADLLIAEGSRVAAG